MNAIIYTRVSSEDQVKGLSLKSQEDSCREYAAKKSYNVLELFKEEGASAKTTDRKRLIELLDYCKKYKGSIDVLIVWKLDRFARHAEDHLTLKAYLARLGIRLESVTEPIEDTSSGRLMETMLAGFAQFDNEVRTERAINGLKGRAAEGCWITRAPLGYTSMRDNANRPTLAIDELRAPIIKRVFEEYSSGTHSLKSIAKFANNLGLRSLGGSRMSSQVMWRMLRNTAYISKRKDYDGTLIPCIHEPLVSETTFYEVQEILTGRRKPLKSDKDDNWPLRAGFLKCAECKSPLTGSSPKGRNKYYSKYSCPTCRVSDGKKNSVDRDEMHRQFIALLQSIRPKKRYMDLFKKVVSAKWEDEYKTMSEDRSHLESSLKTLIARREHVLELFIDGELSKEEKDTQFEKIDAERAAIQIQKSDAEKATIDREELLETAIDFMTNVSTYWERSPLSVQRRFQALVFPEGIEYDFKTGFRTAKIAASYEVIESLHTENRTSGWPSGVALEPIWGGLRQNLTEIYGVMQTI